MKRPHLVSLGCSLVLLAASAKGATADTRLRAARDLIGARAGELLLTLQPATNGIRIVGLRDLTLNEPLLATNARACRQGRSMQ